MHMEMFKEEKKLNTGYTCEKLLMGLGQMCTGFREGGVETNLSNQIIEWKQVAVAMAATVPHTEGPLCFDFPFFPLSADLYYLQISY